MEKTRQRPNNPVLITLTTKESELYVLLSEMLTACVNLAHDKGKLDAHVGYHLDLVRVTCRLVEVVRDQTPGLWQVIAETWDENTLKALKHVEKAAADFRQR